MLCIRGLNSSVFALLLAGPLACSGEKSEGTDGPPTGELPAECSEAEPVVEDSFAVLIDGGFKDHDFSLPCTIDAVTTEMGTSTTSLTCDDAGASIAVTLTLPVAPQGDVAWAVGQTLTLDSRYADLEVTAEREFELRGSDGELWAAGQWQDGPLKPQVFQPLTVGAEAVCGPMDVDMAPRSYRLDFELAGQPQLSLFSGQRGEFALGAGESLVIDVPDARYNTCCHDTESFSVFVRRVKTG
ncbi:hypothetical protein [Nannocystis radixulma]|uniref:Lipoprotein n=1 Tax=Nannocystis radixulma TaxID=2995305 RepID=A0ABT5BB81_9BACT|nr:hypothetical protein [Nannocystis radixulma]MDC0670784.1 hypothetical protein [Nannocystis radixulma]